MTNVTLEGLHIAFADGVVALGRMRRAKKINASAKHGAPGDDTAERHRIDNLGARCECAGYLHFKPVTWNLFEIGKADLDDFIDIKGRSKAWHEMIVHEDDPPQWAYVLVNGEDHPVYEIVKWCWGFEAQREPLHAHGGRTPAHFISREHRIMKPLEELLDILRDRQRRRGDCLTSSQPSRTILGPSGRGSSPPSPA